MDFRTIMELIEKGGVALVSVGAIIFMSWKLLQWGKQIVDHMMVQMSEQGKAWQEVVGKISRALDEHTSNAQIFHTRVDEAHKYQREENKELLGACEKLCNCVNQHFATHSIDMKARADEHSRMIGILDEMKTILVRVNGFRDHGRSTK